jgi:predicted phage tail protein
LLAKIKIHSAFKSLFTELEYTADFKKYADILYYLGAMHPRFQRYAKAIEHGQCQEGYALLDKNLKPISDQDLFIKSVKSDDIFHIVPAIVGGGGKRTQKLLTYAAIATAAYFAAPYVMGAFAGGGSSAVAASGYTGATVGAEAGRTAAFSATLGGGSAASAGLGISAGTLAVNAGLALVTMLFTQRQDIKQTDQNVRSNDMFGGLQNTISSSTPIPLVYGLHRVPGQLISGYLDTVDHGRDDNITVQSRFTT